ncbi:RsmE family RNA methyltransferase [Desulfogranum japonicum]|uniref:RsmE family RNA methyltransferase n=1 Tax=Desulfogranum japonicum TaxID=231447 RepID=UPI0003F55C79|nr:RsmE family RNA methyltransferase [Desulfogranum japonicum]
MRRFFIEPQSIQSTQVYLTGQEAHHICRVLRLRVGDKVELFDGTGRILQARLLTVNKNSVCAEIESCEHESPVAPLYPLTLIQALLKGKKMDFILQKATELGVEHCILFPSQYYAAGKTVDSQMERWQRIIVEACKQCRRPVPMTLTLYSELEEIPLDGYLHKFIAHEDERHTAKQLALSATPGPVSVLIGPEGGWHDEETTYFLGRGFCPVSLGEYILRGETAALAACSILKYLTQTTVQL